MLLMPGTAIQLFHTKPIVAGNQAMTAGQKCVPIETLVTWEPQHSPFLVNPDIVKDMNIPKTSNGFKYKACVLSCAAGVKKFCRPIGFTESAWVQQLIVQPLESSRKEVRQ